MGTVEDGPAVPKGWQGSPHYLPLARTAKADLRKPPWSTGGTEDKVYPTDVYGVVLDGDDHVVAVRTMFTVAPISRVVAMSDALKAAIAEALSKTHGSSTVDGPADKPT